MQRICVPPPLLDVPLFTFPPHVAHYVVHVLRLRVGDECYAFDGTGRECHVRLTHVAPGTVQGERLAVLTPTTLVPSPLVLGQALPKGTKMDLIVEKCSELGLTTLVPLYTARTVVREAPERFAAKLSRWQRLAFAAARQCGRRILLDIATPMTLNEFCCCYSAAPVKLVCWENEGQQSLKTALAPHASHSPIIGLIGPEGGLTQAEVEIANQHGFQSVTLGPRILRTETAAIVLTSIVRYSLGDLDPQGKRG